MGDMAEAMLEGVFCQYCGVYLGDEVGYPRSCSGCGGDDEYDGDDTPRASKPAKQPPSKDQFNEFKKLAEASGCTAKECKNPFHWQVKGKRLVNFWPKKEKYHIAGAKGCCSGRNKAAIKAATLDN